jgi:hypothetical protein
MPSANGVGSEESEEIRLVAKRCRSRRDAAARLRMGKSPK